MKRFYAGTSAHGNLTAYRLWAGKVELRVGPHSGGIRLWYIRSLEPGNGNASKALGWLTALAGHYEVTLRGKAKRMERGGLSTTQLTDWYARHGFTVDVRTGKFKYELCSKESLRKWAARF